MQLHVRVVEATDVPKMDIFGKADPYCLLQLSSSKEVRKTKVCETTYTPVWNQEFHFPVVNQATDVLHILMKDQDRGSADDPISKIEIPLMTLVQGYVTDKWYDMQPVKGVKKGGRLRLVLHLANYGMTPFHKPVMMGQPMMGSMYQQQPMPMYQQQMPMMGAQPMMGQQPMMGTYQQPMMGQPMMGQPMQMYPQQQMPMMGAQPMMGQQPMMGTYQQPMMGQPMMGGYQQPMMGQPMMRPY